VHVRLAAGHDAQQALLQGSPELARLLEHAGATDTRIVVRDLAGVPTGTDSRDPRPGTGTGADGSRPHDQHAGTRAHHPATDGPHDSTNTGANPPRSNEPVTHTRVAGVDVTM
jgi:flagellar hook-length control protein FliK